MPKITKTALEQSIDSPLDQVIGAVGGEITISTSPVLICGVNRKVNIGNFENVDVYAAISLPLNSVSIEDQEALSDAVKEAAAYGFGLVSRETGERYQLIKENQQGK
jgi:hypothetical protein